jgi:hypothetical protein
MLRWLFDSNAAKRANQRVHPVIDLQQIYDITDE